MLPTQSHNVALLCASTQEEPVPLLHEDIGISSFITHTFATPIESLAPAPVLCSGEQAQIRPLWDLRAWGAQMGQNLQGNTDGERLGQG